MKNVIAIKRVDSTDYADWVPILTNKGYKLVSKTIAHPERNPRSSATYKWTLNEAGALEQIRPDWNRGLPKRP